MTGECSNAERPLAAWKAHLQAYENPSLTSAAWQITNTLGPYALIWWAMYRSLSGPWWVSLLLAVAAGAMLVRVFVLMHDCSHGSFLRGRLANDLTGIVLGMVTFTPYYHWRWQHLSHHATSGNLDRRGTGDVWTMTVQEYLASSARERLAYRLSRSPLVLFLLAPFSLFLRQWRFAAPGARSRERHSVQATNVAAAVIASAMSIMFGIWNYLALQSVVFFVAGSCGVWLFFVQHQFEGAYWERKSAWNYPDAALRGSSFYRLPAVLRWLSGNIGYHHVHHLSTRVPNYRLKQCHESLPRFAAVKPLTLFASLKCLRCHLWDEPRRRFVSFSQLAPRAALAYARRGVSPARRTGGDER